MVSIIMLSRNKEQYVEKSVRSVFAQTYKNWELLFIDDNSTDDSIRRVMKLRPECRLVSDDGTVVDRVKVSRTVFERGDINNSNSALKEARGRWIAFLNVGDVWAPTKLERQIRFLEEHGYAFSYHQYRLMDSESKDRGVLIGGKEHVTHRDMQKCCWPGYLTVMYDAEKVGKMKVCSLWTNYYALWLSVSDKYDCYLLPENLAVMRTKWNRLGGMLLTNSFRWRYDAFRVEEDLGRFMSLCYTLRNSCYGVWKWWRYVKRIN